ncbi:MAG TPA: hypothetical protein VIY29_03760 [Ktedonobacteraceae bacterium]
MAGDSVIRQALRALLQQIRPLIGPVPHPHEALSDNQLQQLEYCSLLERALTNEDSGAAVEYRQWLANKHGV